MKVVVKSLLLCSADAAWRKVRTSRLLRTVSQPLVRIQPLPKECLPRHWVNETLVRVRSRLWGLIPLGTREVYFERIDPALRQIQTCESDPCVRRWRHFIRIDPIDNSACWYQDEIEIDAGPLTMVVWLFAQVFYRHRQSRWRILAARRHVKRQLADAEPAIL